ncbi:FecCD family ABC transporter permease [Microbacterium indicum]|uniref:FecCD family ABC transporter permease n=1 Tax=Microbacterium indicum TaxID=358100 RepID=UPI0004239D0A|nr:iron ABC transporter permease [Microbacterium indicum]
MTQGDPTATARVRAGGRTRRYAAWLVACASAIAVFAFVSVCVGPVTIDVSETWRSFTDFDPQNTHHLLAQLQRVPRTILALLVGVCLGLAGAVMQALTRNPLAEPGLLGVNSGAAFAITLGIAVLGVTDVVGYMWLGLAGAAAAAVVVFLLGGARRGTNPVRLVLAGAALTAVLGAASQLVLLNSPDDVYNSYRQWMVGSLAGRGYEVLGPVAVLAAVGAVLALALGRSLDSAVLGDDSARALGANPAVVWTAAGIAVVLLAGAATAAAGPLVFLGLAAPHLARLIVGVGHRRLLPMSAVLGALLAVAADALGRIVVPGHEIGVGIMVAIIGGPFFVWIVRGRRIAAL